MKNNPYSVRNATIRGKNHIEDLQKHPRKRFLSFPFIPVGSLPFFLIWIPTSDVEILCSDGLASTYHIWWQRFIILFLPHQDQLGFQELWSHRPHNALGRVLPRFIPHNHLFVLVMLSIKSLKYGYIILAWELGNHLSRYI